MLSLLHPCKHVGHIIMTKSITLPSSEVVFGTELIIPDGHFNWNEATKNLKIRPVQIAVETNIYEAAKMMEQVRYELGSFPLHVTSWYRNYDHNRKVGGSSKSLHLQGRAVDFYCLYLTPKEIFNILDKKWDKGGLSAYKSHVHIDCRGYKARW